MQLINLYQISQHKNFKNIFQIMKLSFLLCIVAMLQVYATASYSQTVRISLSMNDAKIDEVLDKIEEQSEFYFLYNQKLVDLSKRVTIDVSAKPINEVLSMLFDKEQIDFAVYDRQIIVSPAKMIRPAGFTIRQEL